MNGFLLTVAQAEEFFNRCKTRNANTLAEKLAVMNELVKERQAFFQTEEQIDKRLKGKKVLKVKIKRPDNGI